MTILPNGASALFPEQDLLVQKLLPVWVLLLALSCFALASNALGATPSRPFALYLPAISSAEMGCRIEGSVVLNGQPIADVAVKLNRFNSDYSITTIETFTTTAEATYLFRETPPLEDENAYYYVYYNNPTFASGRLSSWATPKAESCRAGEHIELAPFDIADVELLTPTLGSTASLPVAFSWRPRPASPTDSYDLWLYQEPCCSASTRFNNLGYIDRYTLESLPAGFQTNKPTTWIIEIRAPDGGFGEVRLGWTFRFAP